MLRPFQILGEPVSCVISGSYHSAFSHRAKWHFAAQISVAHFTYVFHPLEAFVLSSLRKKLLQITVFDQTLALRTKQVLCALEQKRLLFGSCITLGRVSFRNSAIKT